MAEGGFSLADTIRVTYILADPADFESCWPLLRRTFGHIAPAATMISARMADPRMRIEIEVTGKRR